MMSTTPQNHHGLGYQKGKFNGNHKKINGLGEDQENLELKTQSLIQKMIKIQIRAKKEILRGIFP